MNTNTDAKPPMTLDAVLEDIAATGNGFWYVRVIITMSLNMALLAVEVNMLSFVVYCAEDTWDLSSWAGDVLVDLSTVGCFLGTMIWGPVADVIGRMHVLWITMAGMVIFGMLSAIAPTFAIFVILRFLTGFCEGAWIVSTTYVLEMLPQEIRGTHTNYVNLAWGLGTMTVSVVAWLTLSTYGWRVFIVVVTSLFILGLPILYTLCESPRWLADQGRHKDAMEALEYMAKANGTDVPCGSLIIQFSEEAGLQGPVSLSFWGVLKKSASNYSGLFLPETLMNTLMLAMAGMLVSTSYHSLLYFDNDVLLGIDGVCAFKYKEIIVIASSEVVVNALITPLLDLPDIPFFGGRRGVTQSCIFVAIVPIVLSGYTIAGQYVWAYIGRGCVLAAFNVLFILVPEMYSTSHRVTSIAFTTMLSYPGIGFAAWLIYSNMSDPAMMWITAAVTFVLFFVTFLFSETAKTELS